MTTIKEIVRLLRKNQTSSEAILWGYLRNRKLENLKFVRQYPIKFICDNERRIFIADFYCAQGRLVIEIDGSIHEKQKEYDELRTKIIEEKRMRVIRFTNRNIESNIDMVLSKIKSEVLGPSLPPQAEREGMPEGQG